MRLGVVVASCLALTTHPLRSQASVRGNERPVSLKAQLAQLTGTFAIFHRYGRDRGSVARTMQ